MSKLDPTPNPSPKERGANFSFLVPNLLIGNAVESKASALQDLYNSPLEKLVPPQREGVNAEGIDGVCDNGSQTLNIGLFGFGCVGKGLYDVLNHSQGLKARITKICVKNKSKERPISKDNFTFLKNDVLDNTSHDLIVELIDDSEAALEIITDSLKKGRNVVTAGKKVVAENFEHLYSLQQQTGASLLYEAACAGSIPIIRTLEEYYDNELLSSVKGILNGSCNYILSKMEFDNLSYTDALKQAQALGFAESDPTLDVNGTDAKYKLCLLSAHAFGAVLKPEDVFNTGIQNISSFDTLFAAKNNLRIKLIAEIKKSGEGYIAYVIPSFIPKNEPLANINYEFNGIEVEGVYSDKQLFTGKGAGSHPTGSAVLSDISAITYNYRYGYKKLQSKNPTPTPPSKTRPSARRGGAHSVILSDVKHPDDNLSVETTRWVVSKPDINVKPLVPQFGAANQFGNAIESKASALLNNFTLRLYIRYSSSNELDLLDIRSIEEEHRSQGGNYIITQVGFASLSNLNDKPNGLFVCEV